MSKIKVITDSTSYITKEYAEENDITVIQLNYTFDGETQIEGHQLIVENIKYKPSNLLKVSSL